MAILTDPQAFLARHWQKEPLFVECAIPAGLPEIEPDELAWLATLPDVESRLVFTERSAGQTRYRLEIGPFEEKALQALPDRDWTLLVQDVEKHLPDFRRYLDEVGFIPDWRIDDLMVSCAAPGGSVGPHVDHYDVFLVQGTGSRHWSLGAADEVEADRQNEGLSLVLPFPEAAGYDAGQRDLLYLPPGMPHWGVARNLCVTMSIGCRAPTRRELQLGQERVLGTPSDGGAGADDQVYYADPDLDVAESIPGRIDPKTIRRIREQGLLDPGLSDLELASIFGSVVTDPKAWLEPEPLGPERLASRLAKTGEVAVHGMARIAWFDSGISLLVFVNGVGREAPSDLAGSLRRISSDRRLDARDCERLAATGDGSSLLAWMAEKGLLDTDHSDE